MTPFHFPQFDPYVFQIGGFGIRWYAIAYIAGLVLGWRIMRYLVRLTPPVATLLQTDDFLTWATLGVVLGGRIGYILFYQPGHYLRHPLDMLVVWHGGMSFHGGAIGVAVAIVVYCRREGMPILGFADRMAIVTPVGLFFGRIANFINGELWGRIAPPGWPGAMIYPQAGPEPRYPSELYQAFLEGIVLFAVMWALSRRDYLRDHFGFLTGAFLCGYGIARFIGEFFRQPDPFLNYLIAGTTMGQLLSIPMIIAGVVLMAWARRQAPQPA